MIVIWPSFHLISHADKFVFDHTHNFALIPLYLTRKCIGAGSHSSFVSYSTLSHLQMYWCWITFIIWPLFLLISPADIFVLNYIHHLVLIPPYLIPRYVYADIFVSHTCNLALILPYLTHRKIFAGSHLQFGPCSTLTQMLTCKYIYASLHS